MENLTRFPWKKKIVSWKEGRTLCMSIPFTWLLPTAKKRAQHWNGPVVVGGPAAYLVDIDWAEVRKETAYDVLKEHTPYATFTTRGCPNRCSFCAVPKLEGDFRELKDYKVAPIICDNNLLECSNNHFSTLIEKLRRFRFVDFNQGLEARRLTFYHVSELQKLRGLKIRFAFNRINDESSLIDAITLCQKNHLKNISVYVLFGYKDTPEDTYYRLELVRKYQCFPNPMRYQPLDARTKNSYVNTEKGWTEHKLKKIQRYYSRLIYFGKIPYKEFYNTVKEKNEMTKFTIPKKNKPDKDENFIKFEIPTDPIQAICGQERVKRAIEISIAGEYSLCIYGPSGQGKTQLLTAYREIYMKIYRRKVPYTLYDIDEYPTKKDVTLYVKVDKLPYSTINKGFNGLTSKEIVSKINKRLLITDLFITPDFWDILGQTYSRDALTPKQVFSALKVARTIANLEQSEIITRTHFKEALVLVTFPQLKVEKESTKEMLNNDT